MEVEGEDVRNCRGGACPTISLITPSKKRYDKDSFFETFVEEYSAFPLSKGVFAPKSGLQQIKRHDSFMSQNT